MNARLIAALLTLFIVALPSSARAEDRIAATARWMTGLGIPVPAPRVIVGGTEDQAGAIRPNTLLLHPSAAVAVLSGYDPGTIIHELSHLASAEPGTVSEWSMDEAAAESTARDLIAPWRARFHRDGGSDFFAYAPQVAWLRHVSSVATGTAWTSWSARRWRLRFVAGNRAGMLRAVPPRLRMPPPL